MEFRHPLQRLDTENLGLTLFETFEAREFSLRSVSPDESHSRLFVLVIRSGTTRRLPPPYTRVPLSMKNFQRTNSSFLTERPGGRRRPWQLILDGNSERWETGLPSTCPSPTNVDLPCLSGYHSHFHELTLLRLVSLTVISA